MIPENKYQIAVVDDEFLFRKGMALMINTNARLNTFMQAEDGVDLFRQLKSSNNLPHLILCDLEMPNMNGVEVTKKLIQEYPNTKIVILSSHYEPSLILKMIEIGASGYMPKNEKPVEFFNTIISVIEKGFYYNDYVVQLIREKMFNGTKKNKGGHHEVALTEREEEVLKLVCHQKTNKEIGEEIFISSRTVEGYRNRLLEKTRSKNTAGLIIFAIENGYFPVKIKKGWIAE